MPLLNITDSHLTQRCASCESERELLLEDFEQQAEAEPLENGVLALPPCPCGAWEFLIRSPTDEPPHPSPGSAGHLHRLAVDALVDEVKARGKGAKGSKVLETALRERMGAKVASDWFPSGLKLAPPNGDELGDKPKKTKDPA